MISPPRASLYINVKRFQNFLLTVAFVADILFKQNKAGTVPVLTPGFELKGQHGKHFAGLPALF